jgi:hypothetical protein
MALFVYMENGIPRTGVTECSGTGRSQMTEKVELFAGREIVRRSTIILNTAQKRWTFDTELSAIGFVISEIAKPLFSCQKPFKKSAVQRKESEKFIFRSLPFPLSTDS